MILPTGPGPAVKANVKTIAISTATVSAPAKLPTNTRPQLRSTPPSVTPGRLSISASGRQHEHARHQVEAQQIEHAEADREQHRADEGQPV